MNKCINCEYIGSFWDFYDDETYDGEAILKCPKCGNFAGENENQDDLFPEIENDA